MHHDFKVRSAISTENTFASYFRNGEASAFFSASIAVCYTILLSVAEILNEFHFLSHLHCRQTRRRIAMQLLSQKEKLCVGESDIRKWFGQAHYIMLSHTTEYFGECQENISKLFSVTKCRQIPFRNSVSSECIFKKLIFKWVLMFLVC